MQRLEKEFSGDFRVLRVIFSTSNPIEALHNIKFKYSFKTFMEMYEYLDANEALEEDARRIAKARAQQEANKK